MGDFYESIQIFELKIIRKFIGKGFIYQYEILIYLSEWILEISWFFSFLHKILRKIFEL